MSMFAQILSYNALGVLVAITVCIIAYFKWKYTFWKRHGVPYLEPTIPFGNAKDILLVRTTLTAQFDKFYQETKKRGWKHIGMYTGFMPTYVPTDPEILKNILQKDFEHFVNHGTYLDEENDPLSGHLFGLTDQRWRNMRVKLTPTFTSGKMKMMFQTFVTCAGGLQDVMEQCVKKEDGVDIKEILARFTTDIIGSAAFGLDCNSLKDPDAEFRKYGKRIFEPTRARKFKQILLGTVPQNILHLFKFRLSAPDVEEFFRKVVKETVEYRETNNVYRKDFMHLLIQLKNLGKVTDDGKVKHEDGTVEEKGLTFNEILAQAFVFFIAGFETSSTLMTFTLFELAQDQDVQQKLREEIISVLAKHNNEITYDSVNDMKYLEQVLNEALRKHPPVPFLPRNCSKDYQVPGTSAHIPKGTRVIIPSFSIHHDPKYYPDPEKFDPERFTEKNKAARSQFTFLPFGQGPRLCIGLRFGMMQSKVGLITLLKNYKISLNKKTVLPMRYEKKSAILSIEGGLWLNVEKVN